MEKVNNISFVENATMREAFILSFRYAGVFFCHLWRAFDKIVHRYPWYFIGAIMLGSFVISYINIAEARTERDKYNKEYTMTETQLEQYKLVYDK